MLNSTSSLKQCVTVLVFLKNDVEHTHLCQQFWL